MSSIRKWIILAQFCMTVMVSISPAYGQIKQIAPNQEYKAKANFFFNFAKFTTWPKDVLAEGDRIQFCVLGTDPFGLFLDVLAIRTVKGRQINLRRLASSDQAQNCHLLFLAIDAVTEEGRMPAELSRRGLFVVADTPGLAKRGAIVSLQHENGDVWFDINVGAARNAALILDTQLLRLGHLTTDAENEQP